MSKNKIFLPCHSSVKWSDPGDFLKAQFVIFRCQKYVKKRVHRNEKMNLLCAFKKCSGSLHFTLLSAVFFNLDVPLKDWGMIFCKINCLIQRFFRDRRVQFFYVQLYELTIQLFIDVTKPVNNFLRIFLLIVLKLGKQVFVDVL